MGCHMIEDLITVLRHWERNAENALLASKVEGLTEYDKGKFEGEYTSLGKTVVEFKKVLNKYNVVVK